MVNAKIPSMRACLFGFGAVLLAAGVVLGFLLVPSHSKGAHGTSSAAVAGGSAPESRGSAVPAAEAEAIRANVVRVRVTASSCGRHSEASGFAYGAERVLTTAHVVAGSRGAITVIGGNGARYRGTVVVLDPDRDVAVLKVPTLEAQNVDFGSVDRGANVTIAGYPEGGAFAVFPAKVQDKNVAQGPNIYFEGLVRREVLQVHGQAPIKRGVAGGPVFAADRKFAGMFFGVNIETEGSGFVLSFREIASRMMDGLKATKAVSTRQCSR